MALSTDPCPACGKAGAQLLRCRPNEWDYFCESCSTEFVIAPVIPPKRMKVVKSRVAGD